MAALEAKAGGWDRAEGDRARAILLTLRGWTSARIAEAFGVWEDNTVRLWNAQAEAGDITPLFADESEAPDPSLVLPALDQTRRESITLVAGLKSHRKRHPLPLQRKLCVPAVHE
jgi:transposase-like protein